MGLSDEERLQGIYRVVDELTRIEHDWNGDYLRVTKEDWLFPRFRELLRQLWPALLAARPCDEIWDMAMQHHLDPEWGGGGPSEAMRWIMRLLKDWPLWRTFTVYERTEELVYFLYRYKDLFLAKHEQLAAVVGRIRGECFKTFCEHSEFAKAHLIRQIAPLIYDSADKPRQELLKLMEMSLSSLQKHCADVLAAQKPVNYDQIDTTEAKGEAMATTQKPVTEYKPIRTYKLCDGEMQEDCAGEWVPAEDVERLYEAAECPPDCNLELWLRLLADMLDQSNENRTIDEDQGNEAT